MCDGRCYRDEDVFHQMNLSLPFPPSSHAASRRRAGAVARGRRGRATRPPVQSGPFFLVLPAFRCWVSRGRRSCRSSRPPRTPGCQGIAFDIRCRPAGRNGQNSFIVAVSARRRRFAIDDTVVYGAAAGLGFCSLMKTSLISYSMRDVAGAGGVTQRPRCVHGARALSPAPISRSGLGTALGRTGITATGRASPAAF